MQNVDIIPIIALIFSIPALIISLKGYIRDKGNIKIILSIYDLITADNGEYGVDLEEIIQFKIVNIGRRPLTIEKIFVKFDDNKKSLVNEEKKTLNEKCDYIYSNIKEDFLIQLLNNKKNVKVKEIIVECSDGNEFKKKLTSYEIKTYF